MESCNRGIISYPEIKTPVYYRQIPSIARPGLYEINAPLPNPSPRGEGLRTNKSIIYPLLSREKGEGGRGKKSG